MLDLDIVINQAKLLIEHWSDPSFARACANAVQNLLGRSAGLYPTRKKGTLVWREKLEPIPATLRGNVLNIRSARIATKVYTCTGCTCTCDAIPSKTNPAGWCWHRAAWTLLIAERAITDPFYFFTAPPAGDGRRNAA